MTTLILSSVIVLLIFLYVRARLAIKEMKKDLKEKREMNKGLIAEVQKLHEENELLANPIYQRLKN